MVVQSGKPLPIVDRETREAKLQKDITEEFDALAAGTTAEREVLEGPDLTGRGVHIPRPGPNELTAGSLRGQNYIIALESVTDEDLKRMSTPQKLAVALQYAGKHDMFQGETADAMIQLVQKENLAILAFVSLSLWALAGVATLAAGAAGPPGWFIALVGASFAALAGFELAAKGLQLKRSLESTTHLSELKEPAQLAAELVAMVPVEALMALLGALAVKLGGKLGNRIRKVHDGWKQKEADRKRPRTDESQGSETGETTPPRNTPPGNVAFLKDLEFHGLKPVDIRPGTNGKIAVIGRPMGGKTTTNSKRPLGVRDYHAELKKMGYDAHIYEPRERGELRGLKEKALKTKGITPTAEAIDELRLPDDVIKTTQSYQNQRKWAETLRDEDWTVIDLGDNTADEVPGAYYEAELEILFPARSAPQTQRSQP